MKASADHPPATRAALVVCVILLYAGCATNPPWKQNEPAAPTARLAKDNLTRLGLCTEACAPALNIRVVRTNSSKQFVIDRIILEPKAPRDGSSTRKKEIRLGQAERILEVKAVEGDFDQRWLLDFDSAILYDGRGDDGKFEGGAIPLALEAQEVRLLCEDGLDLWVILKSNGGTEIQRLLLANLITQFALDSSSIEEPTQIYPK